MAKKGILLIISVITLIFAGCSYGMDKEPLQEKKTEFSLISQNEIFELNSDISNINLEPVKVEYGSGDGFKWTNNYYADIEIKALYSDDNTTSIIKISTKSSLYETPKGIKVGDVVEKLVNAYREDLLHPEYVDKEYYVYDPENDIGFNRIYFCIENDVINEIIIENGIDG